MTKPSKHRATQIDWTRGQLRQNLEGIARAIHPSTVRWETAAARASLDALATYGLDRQTELEDAKAWVLRHRGYDVAITHV